MENGMTFKGILRCVMAGLTSIAFAGGFFAEVRHGMMDGMVNGLVCAIVPAIFLGLLFVKRVF